MMRTKMDDQPRRFDANGNDVTDVGVFSDAVRIVEDHKARADAGDPEAQRIIADHEAAVASKAEAVQSLQSGGDNLDPDAHPEDRPIGAVFQGDESKVNPNAVPLAETEESGTRRRERRADADRRREAGTT